ncbi:MAG: hypothetical protein CL623_01990 [Arcobacter sp.]|nr:hypothetical protein [Arcobacter sp.]|tara:strand:- start:8740 stop:8994 length:255 start_codon:yes stop_codon:yes gene_type:complete
MLVILKGKAMSENHNTQVVKTWIDENYSVGDALPDLYYIADATGFARGTVREAVKYLEARGVLHVRHGKRTIYRKDVYSDEEHF